MGNTQNSVQEALKGFEFHGNKNRPAYGYFKLLLNDGTGEKIAVKHYVSDKFREIEETYNTALVLQESHNRFFLSTTGYLTSSENICSNFHKLSLYVEFIELTLADSKIIDAARSKEILNDFQSRKMDLNSFDETDRVYPRDFTENDYLHIIFCVASGLGFLHSNGRYHGCVNPWTILESNGSFKIGDHMLLNGNSCFIELMSDPHSKCYIAPELFACLPNGEISPEISQHKGDIYALGMTLLCLIKGVKPEIFYNFKDYTVNLNLIQQHLQSVKFNNSEEFHDLLCAMLDFNPEERLSAEEILLFLNRVYGPEEFANRNDNIFVDRLSDHESFNEGLSNIREENKMQPPMDFSQELNHIPEKREGDILFRFSEHPKESLVKLERKHEEPLISKKPSQYNSDDNKNKPLNHSQISHGSRFSIQAKQKSQNQSVASEKNGLNDYYEYFDKPALNKSSRIMYKNERNHENYRVKTEQKEESLNGNSRIDEVLKKSRASNNRFEFSKRNYL